MPNGICLVAPDRRIHLVAQASVLKVGGHDYAEIRAGKKFCRRPIQTSRMRTITNRSSTMAVTVIPLTTLVLISRCTGSTMGSFPDRIK